MISAWDIIRLVFYLGLLLGMTYGILFLMKRFVYRTSSSGKSNMDMKILSTQMIMPKKFVSAVKIDKHVYLLGITDYSFTLLDKSDAPADEAPSKDGMDSTLLARLRKSIKIS